MNKERFCFNGDHVRLRSGETAEVLDTWGIARTWHKLKTRDGTIIFAMAGQIESVVKRHSNRKGWGKK